jgi:hypothetical protein
MFAMKICFTEINEEVAESLLSLSGYVTQYYDISFLMLYLNNGNYYDCQGLFQYFLCLYENY